MEYAEQRLQYRRGATARVQQLKDLHEKSSAQFDQALFASMEPSEDGDTGDFLRMAQSKAEAKEIIWQQYREAERTLLDADTAWLEGHGEALQLEGEAKWEKWRQADLAFIEAVGGLQA